MSERETKTIAGALAEAARVLGDAGVAEARREAGSLLAHALGRDRTFLITHGDDELGGDLLARFRRLAARRAAGEPLQYIRGAQEFFGLDFEVTPDVLIPRPETELLVEAALELLAGTQAPRVCDVGTGSGCVVVSLLHGRGDARGVGLDISPPAVRVAARNAARHDVAARLELFESDCFSALEGAGRVFDVIVSNPPYIPERDIADLQREVRDHEPRAALTPGGDGLRIIRRLV
ncbi:MAG TPA: peptide chain release factor N(5)-glutamine methyltransferase, partial [Pyrinomonadaceae bacterium]|nr:peptide chain release factor N(5)-glutamine methyltransferase [Pyrinomonadaceae bacterium]